MRKGSVGDASVDLAQRPKARLGGALKFRIVRNRIPFSRLPNSHLGDVDLLSIKIQKIADLINR